MPAGRRVQPERIAEARRLLAMFMSVADMERELTRSLGISLRAARRVVRAARDSLDADTDGDREAKRAEVRASLRECVRLALQPGPRQSIRAALQALEALVALDGLAEATRFAVSHEGFNTDGAVLGKTALLERLAELRGKEN